MWVVITDHADHTDSLTPQAAPPNPEIQAIILQSGDKIALLGLGASDAIH